MRSCTQNFLNKIAASSRSIKARIVYSGGTYYSTDYIKEINIETASEDGKWFGTSVSQKAVVKLLKVNHTLSSGSIFTVSFAVPSTSTPPTDDWLVYQSFYVDSISTDSKSGEVTITGYDLINNLSKHTYSELGYSESSEDTTVEDVLFDCARLIGLDPENGDVVISGGTNWSVKYFGHTYQHPYEINANPNTTIRELVDDIAELTGTAITTLNGQIYAKAPESVVAYNIRKSSYYDAKKNDGITLTGLAAVCTIKGTIKFPTTPASGYVQALNDNMFLTLLPENQGTSPTTQPGIQQLLSYNYLVLSRNAFAYSLDWIANPILEYGDRIRIYTSDTEYFDTYYLNEQLSYNGGLKATSTWNKANETVLSASSNLNISDYFRTKVSKNDVISSINMTPESITISANKINLTGYVTMTDLSTAGSTEINGANITTGTLSANKITTGTMSANRISGGTINANTTTINNINASKITSGSLSADRISGGAISASSIELHNEGQTTVFSVSNTGELSTVGGSINTQSLKVSESGNESTLSPTALITNNITALSTTSSNIITNKIRYNSGLELKPSTSVTSTDTRYFNVIVSEDSSALNSWWATVISYSDSSKTTETAVPQVYSITVNLKFGDIYSQFQTESKQISISIPSGQSRARLNFTTTTWRSVTLNTFGFLPTKTEMPAPHDFITTSGAYGLVVNKNIIPNATGIYDLGTTSNATLRWRTIYLMNAPDVASDRNLKHNITPLSDKYSELFDNLKPVSFAYNGSEELHTGLIAQDVEEALNKAELSNSEFSGLAKYENDDGIGYSLRYEEFISLLIKEVQDLKAKVKSLEEGDN